MSHLQRDQYSGYVDVEFIMHLLRLRSEAWGTQ
jgi:hypothetical protein